jgi:hypothetical protein
MEAWEPEPPPCDECDRPRVLVGNRNAYTIWSVCHANGRLPSFAGIGPISASEAITVAASLFDGTHEDVLKALRFDQYFLSRYHENMKKEDK